MRSRYADSASSAAVGRALLSWPLRPAARGFGPRLSGTLRYAVGGGLRLLAAVSTHTALHTKRVRLFSR